MAGAKPFLMFQGECEAALSLYAALVPGSSITSLAHYAPGGQGPEGKVSMANAVIAGQEIMAFDSPVKHAFTFTPAWSLFVTCDSADELERLAAGLADGGSFLMEPGDHGFSKRFAWVADRFGVSWQLNLP
jgi:predicted 3-demethylubiquinone-9 3-methyltransferase (glyoxalase superfamily)